MPNEKINIDGRQVETLKELLRPRLRAVVVGFNPSPKSVEVGHYYQGSQGTWFWNQLERYAIVSNLPAGLQDIVAFENGIGFADLVRNPTRNSRKLPPEQIRKGALALISRLNELGEPRPLIVFRYPDIANKCNASIFKQAGFSTFLFPSQFDPPDKKHRVMKLLVKRLSNFGCYR